MKFVHDDVVYCKYYEVVYILFHTGMRISEFCGLTLKDIDLENKTVNIDHQLQRTSSMEYVIESTKTNAGTRVLPITDEVAKMLRIDQNTKWKKWWEGTRDFYSLTKRECHLWPCTGNIDLRVWWEGTMKSIKCRCQRLLLMCAAIHIVPTWPSKE